MSKNSVFPLNKISYIRNFGWVNIIKALKKTVCILDVGCGSGYLLQEMNVLGYKNLTGIDAFIKNDISICKGKVKIFRQDIFHHTTMYDLIMCHHSFEHMDNPRSVLEQLYKMLNQNGFLLIRIPVADSFAFRKYGSNWFQLDAPRHFFLYTTKSITILGKSAGFVLKQIVYDSTESQFLESEKYRRGISLFEKEYFPSGYLQECKKQALLLNQIMDGDQACFLFQKTN
jgi:2-polyprenyl-3-methyl-5-hydroxy-6-metoxy-1,4-benzoquinol methylase